MQNFGGLEGYGAFAAGSSNVDYFKSQMRIA